MAKTIESLTIKKIEQLPATETCTCSICRKLIYKRSLQNSDELPKNRNYFPYWSVTTGHYDWGNDSGDSIDRHEVCSVDCLQILFDAYKEESKDGGNTCYFQAQHERVWGYV